MLHGTITVRWLRSFSCAESERVCARACACVRRCVHACVHVSKAEAPGEGHQHGSSGSGMYYGCRNHIPAGGTGTEQIRHPCTCWLIWWGCPTMSLNELLEHLYPAHTLSWLSNAYIQVHVGAAKYQ